ncbi:MAG: ATP-binding cassette domain-containing protein, partial [Amylibacter sp.]
MHDPNIAIEIKGLNKWYGDFKALTDVSLTVSDGERVVICGPSGSGKSTLIRCVNSLENHDSGQIAVNSKLLAGKHSINKITSEVGMVFQNFNLFPHLTVLQNLTLGPIKARGMLRKNAEERAMAYLERVRIPEQANKKPAQLSGGQQQRVAIAR